MVTLCTGGGSDNRRWVALIHHTSNFEAEPIDNKDTYQRNVPLIYIYIHSTTTTGKKFEISTSSYVYWTVHHLDS